MYIFYSTIAGILSNRGHGGQRTSTPPLELFPSCIRSAKRQSAETCIAFGKTKEQPVCSYANAERDDAADPHCTVDKTVACISSGRR